MNVSRRTGPEAVEPLESRLLLAAELLGDVNAEPLPSNPGSFTTLGDATFFVADDGVHGQEMFRTDGTTAGTSLVRDLLPGPEGSRPFGLTAFDGHLYFLARDSEQRYRLFRSDGTGRGTVQLSDSIEATWLYIQWASTEVRTPLVAAGEHLYFYGQSDEDGFELFKSDGTSEGTRAVSAFIPGANPIPPEVPKMSMADFNGSLVFTASDEQGLALWKTDGESIWRLKGMPTNSGARNFTAVGETLFFVAAIDDAGLELWKTDGTPAGTVLVEDIDPRNVGHLGGNAGPFNLTPLNGKLLFYAHDGTHGYEPWVSDGTRDGTVMVEDVRPGNRGSSDYYGLSASGIGAEYPLAVRDGVAYFAADDGTHGVELWRSDGTAAGTFMLYDLEPTPADPERESLAPTGMRFDGDTLYFFASDDFWRPELWKSDLTAEGTVRVTELSAADQHPPARPPAAGSGFVFGFNELFVSDGTAEGTGLLKDLNADTRGADPTAAVKLDDGTVIFVANDRLYRTDGTPGGTRIVDANFNLYPWVSRLVSAGDVAYFAAHSDAGFLGYGLWKTDGTAEGTKLVKGFPYDDPHQPAEILSITPAGDIVFVKVQPEEGGLQLWATDGSEAGTVLVKEINQTYEPHTGAPPLPDAAHDGRLYFTHDDGVHGPELWTSDGTPAGTKLVNDVLPGPGGIGAISFFVHDGTLYFQSAAQGDASTGYSNGLFKVEVDSEGVFHTPILMSALSATEPFRYAALGDAFYLTARRSNFDGLYVLGKVNPDGSTAMVRDFVATPDLVAYDGKIYFVDHDAAHGYELWVTDGSPFGARLFKDIYPGDIGSMNEPRGKYPFGTRSPQFTVANGRLYFVARDAVHGRHLFVTDGTAAGTRPAAVTRQRATGVAGSDPVILLGTDDDLYFASDHARYGFELFHLHPDEASPTIVSARYRLDTPTPAIAITFSEDVGDSLDTFDFTLSGELPGGLEAYPSGLFDLEYDRASNTAWLRLHRPLADGDYVLTVGDGSAVTDAAYNPLAPRDVLRFSHLNGDANGDGRINADDYFRIDHGFLAQPPDPLFSQGDFNYDGTINADDYFLIDQAFLGQGAPLADAVPTGTLTGSAAAPAVPAEPQDEVVRKRTLPRLFSDEPVVTSTLSRRISAARRR